MTRNSSFIITTAGAISVLWAILVLHMLPGSRVHDFLNIYTGAKLAKQGRFSDLHDPSVQLESERETVPQTPELIPFVRPLFYAIFLEPLALLPQRTAFVIWVAFQSVLLVACWIWGWWRFGPESLLYAVLFLPAALGIGAGQDSPTLLAILILAYALNDRGKPFAAGAVLGLMLIKFHLALLWPLALVISRRWRMLSGFCVVAAIELALTISTGGLADASRYVALLRNRGLAHLSPAPQRMVSYEGFLANFRVEGGWPAALIVGAVVAILLISVRRAPTWKLFALTPVACLIAVPHVYGYDLTVLLLPAWLIIFKSPRAPQQMVAALFCTPIPFILELGGPPWSIAASAYLILLFLVVAVEFDWSGPRSALPDGSKL